MKAVNLFEYLSNNEYPGRGIAIGRCPCGKKMRIAYFIMGRSENSRNRVFVEEGQGIRTEAFDPSKMVDPSLIIYSPVRVYGNTQIVTNGDQTDTVYDFLAAGKSFEDALRTRTFEPDGPNWTPRISAVVNGAGYTMSILKSADGNENSSSILPMNCRASAISFTPTVKTAARSLPSKANRFSGKWKKSRLKTFPIMSGKH